jgi:repressor LexA
MKQLTHRQQQVLDYIKEHLSDHGYPPTLREIAGRFDLSGPRAAVKHLEALGRKGHIRRSPGSSRGIEVLFPGNTLRSSGQEVVTAGRGIPVLGTVPAGPLDLAIEDEENTLILDPSIAHEGTFLLKVKGDSMTGDHILPGDMVLVNKQDTAAQGDIVVVLIGEEATLKRFKREGKKIILMPSNPDYQPVVLNEHSDSVRIIGKIEAVIRITGRQKGSP